MASLWQQILATSALEWFGTVTGLAGVALSIRQHRAAWPLFIACYAAYAWLSTGAELYAAAGMNAVFVGLSLQGWRSWNNEDTGAPSRSTAAGRLAALGVWLASSAAVAGILHAAGGSTSPLLDASATSAGFVAQWLLTRKRIETWAFWLLSDVAFMVLYGRAGYGLTVGLFGVFTALALHGAYTWRKALEPT
ncbi:MAG: nicotinamide riboside transporter PnuC [Myxococcota bacterium]